MFSTRSDQMHRSSEPNSRAARGLRLDSVSLAETEGCAVGHATHSRDQRHDPRRAVGGCFSGNDLHMKSISRADHYRQSDLAHDPVRIVALVLTVRGGAGIRKTTLRSADATFGAGRGRTIWLAIARHWSREVIRMYIQVQLVRAEATDATGDSLQRAWRLEA